ncbi:MAG TPA: ABC transporter ATP-binding protein [Candidatus Cloacimonas sp.]|nr:ABC transporter ATP-binding protein [Candidatus Cloacimonas sp.]
MITITNLSKSYGFTDALIEVNLEIEPGKVYGVVGPNGAGKTTLFNCLAGLTGYTGSIAYKQKDIRNFMGFLPTEPYFLSWITAREHLQLICNARKIKNIDLDKANIFELPLDRFASGYSTGMKKKLALLGILIQQNQFFILDEPFNGVDIQSNLLISEIILALRAKGRTLIISSHILSSLTEICDHFIILKDGRVVQQANRDEFADIERQMKKAEIGDKLQRLHL